MRFRRARTRREEAAELNITAFLNLMVILVPFLLITAVFTRMAVLELNLPSSSQTAQVDPSLRLEVTVRQDRITVGTNKGAVYGTVEKVKIETDPDEEPPLDAQGEPRIEEFDYPALSSLIQDIREKDAFEGKLDATILLEPDIEYDVLIQVMDAVRVTYEDGEPVELFPEISIGDA